MQISEIKFLYGVGTLKAAISVLFKTYRLKLLFSALNNELMRYERDPGHWPRAVYERAELLCKELIACGRLCVEDDRMSHLVLRAIAMLSSFSPRSDSDFSLQALIRELVALYAPDGSDSGRLEIALNLISDNFRPIVALRAQIPEERGNTELAVLEYKKRAYGTIGVATYYLASPDKDDHARKAWNRLSAASDYLESAQRIGRTLADGDRSRKDEAAVDELLHWVKSQSDLL